MSAAERIKAALGWSWWLLWAPFFALAVYFAVESGCSKANELAQGPASHPIESWLAALVYIGAHVWMLTAYVQTLARGRSPIPDLARVRATWQGQVPKIALMLGAFVVNYAPVSLWRAIGAGIFSCTIN